jgi:hypothetical protein
VIAAWPSFALIGAYEMLMRHVRRSAGASGKTQLRKSEPQIPCREVPGETVERRRRRLSGPSPHSQRLGGQGGASRNQQQKAWQCALAKRASDGSLPSGREIARQYGRHERWGRLVERSGSAGEFAPDCRHRVKTDPQASGEN